MMKCDTYAEAELDGSKRNDGCAKGNNSNAAAEGLRTLGSPLPFPAARLEKGPQEGLLKRGAGSAILHISAHGDGDTHMYVSRLTQHAQERGRKKLICG